MVPDPSRLGLFVAAAVVLLLTPGPAVLYIVTRSLDQGRRAGLVSVLIRPTSRSPASRRFGARSSTASSSTC